MLTGAPGASLGTGAPAWEQWEATGRRAALRHKQEVSVAGVMKQEILAGTLQNS
jgi:hypothetical protein